MPASPRAPPEQRFLARKSPSTPQPFPPVKHTPAQLHQAVGAGCAPQQSWAGIPTAAGQSAGKAQVQFNSQIKHMEVRWESARGNTGQRHPEIHEDLTSWKCCPASVLHCASTLLETCWGRTRGSEALGLASYAGGQLLEGESHQQILSSPAFSPEFHISHSPIAWDRN